VEKFLKAKWDDNGLKRPMYQGDLPEGNDGLGLMLLGCTGDKILPADVYEKSKPEPWPACAERYKQIF
jgi:methylmalonyl-CoA mutase